MRTITFEGDIVTITTQKGNKEWCTKWRYHDGDATLETLIAPDGDIMHFYKYAKWKKFVPRTHLEIIRKFISEEKVVGEKKWH
jgi:hypothetical protein